MDAADAPPWTWPARPAHPVLAELQDACIASGIDRHRFYLTAPKLLDIVGFGRCANDNSPSAIEYELDRIGWYDHVGGGPSGVSRHRARILEAIGATLHPSGERDAIKEAAKRAAQVYTTRNPGWPFIFSSDPVHRTIHEQPQIFSAKSRRLAGGASDAPQQPSAAAAAADAGHSPQRRPKKKARRPTAATSPARTRAAPVAPEGGFDGDDDGYSGSDESMSKAAPPPEKKVDCGMQTNDADYAECADCSSASGGGFGGTAQSF